MSLHLRAPKLDAYDVCTGDALRSVCVDFLLSAILRVYAQKPVFVAPTAEAMADGPTLGAFEGSVEANRGDDGMAAWQRDEGRGAVLGLTNLK